MCLYKTTWEVLLSIKEKVLCSYGKKSVSFFFYIGPRVYQVGSSVIALVHGPPVCLSVNISKDCLLIFLKLCTKLWVNKVEKSDRAGILKEKS